jgi:transposase
MKSIPIAMRQRIIELYDKGKTTREIAAALGFCVAAVRRVRQQFQERGSLTPQTDRCGRKSLLTAERKALLHQILSQKPDATLAELGAQMDRPFGTSTVDLWLRQLGWNYKKNPARDRASPTRRGAKKGRLA